jgi:hypothetical protein
MCSTTNRPTAAAIINDDVQTKEFGKNRRPWRHLARRTNLLLRNIGTGTLSHL